ncbi:MAG: hypothetical protein ACE5JU_14060 [Candidatus Binatia bacterium]
MYEAKTHGVNEIFSIHIFHGLARSFTILALLGGVRGFKRIDIVIEPAGLERKLAAILDADTFKAEEVLIESYALAHEKGSIPQELNLLPLLCELHVRTGRMEQARQDLKLALAAPVYLAEGLLATAGGDWSDKVRMSKR